MEIIAPLGRSDHNGLEVGIVGMAADKPTKELVPDWAKANMQEMRTKLEQVDWEEEFREMGGVECMDKFYSVVEQVTKDCVPMKLRRGSNKPLWMTGNIMRLLRRKRRLWRAYSTEEYYGQDFRDYMAYKEIQQEIKREVKKAKRKLERDLAKKAKKNPKRF